MGLISIPSVFTVGAVIIASQHNANFSTIYSEFNGLISDVNISGSAAISDSKLAQITTANKVSGASLTSLSSIPSGAGIIPSANLPTQGPSDPYIKITNTQISGTDGGTATLGAWRTIPLNTKDIDTSSIATLSSNQISIPSGNYIINAICPFYQTSFGQTRLYNITDSSTIFIGTNGISTTTVSFLSYIMGRFTISGTKTIEFQYQVSATQSTNGLGRACNFGSEIYATIELIKVA